MREYTPPELAISPTITKRLLKSKFSSEYNVYFLRQRKVAKLHTEYIRYVLRQYIVPKIRSEYMYSR